ncbi:alpha/beta fold hydrolase [Pseudonocardia endophytica]|uniref:Pimeloyl-ACP methyl ester carboxylesterase n=1 Tax=Pseudonocardia endophytica TaxID=401976 RepID=A0A4R1I2L7_PSEEN|nr:alpha/beta hydrolase [Pseudonocardia endophytica]TCK27865.1 pimeloyl-ACP methyl ester carboxylesterase [Pseudonocardia endophytica]
MPTRVVGDSGPPVMLLPGGAEEVDGFFPGLVEGLVADPGCRVILHDRPGTGTSTVDGSLADAPSYLASLIGELGLGPVVVVGQSLGGGVATLLARDHPDVLAGVVLLDPTPVNDASGCARLERSMRLTERLCRVTVLRRLLSASLGRSFARQRAKLTLRPDCEAAHRKIGDLDLPRLARSVHGITELSAGMRESDLPRHIPAVVVTADRKPSNSIRRSHTRVAQALGAELVSWPGAMHNLQLDHPDETLETVRDLVRRVAAATS